MAAILSWWKVADPVLFFYWSVLSSGIMDQLKLTQRCGLPREDPFAHPLLCSSLQWLGEVGGCGMDDLQQQKWRTFGRSETKDSSFLRLAWSGIGFIISWQLISSYMIWTVHLYWEITVPLLSDFIAVHRIVAWCTMILIYIFTEQRLVAWCLSQQDPTLTLFLIHNFTLIF